MKKILGIILGFLIPAGMFANVMVHLDGDCLGAFTTFSHDCFEEVPNVIDNEFVPFGALSGTGLWEFNSKDTEANIHFFAGLDTGLALYGIQLSPIGGFSLNIAEYNKLRVEMLASVEMGPLITIFGQGLLFWQESIDFVLLSNSRKGFYGGLGLTNLNILEANYFVGYGSRFWVTSFSGTHLLLGYRF